MTDRMPLCLAALLVISSVTCLPSSSQTDGMRPTIEGTWAGTLSVQNAAFPLAVTFEYVDGEIRGDVDIIASLSPDIEVADIRVDAASVSFSVLLSGGSLRFEGVASQTDLTGVATYSRDAEVRGNFSLTSVPFESLPAWARGGNTWTWPDNHRPGMRALSV